MGQANRIQAARSPHRIPLWVKVVYTAFVCVLVPYYWVTYTPWNFLYFCDIALLVTLPALWLESPFLVSTQTVAILLPQTLWVIDFSARLLAGVDVVGMTAYMFNPGIPLFVRGLSSFHGWLPFLLLWLVFRLGYDRRAFLTQSVFGVAVLLVCYFLAPGPPPSVTRPNAAVNINYVYGLDDRQAQTWMAPGSWFGLLVTFTLVGLYVPTHAALQKLVAAPASPSTTMAASTVQ
jgi:hypothetical protein